MSLKPCLDELLQSWFPHTTDAGLDRIIELLGKGSPLLIHGTFTKAMPQGCLASHIAWNHPETADRHQEAGVLWLTRVAKLNPATSEVIQAWDQHGMSDWELRCELLEAFQAEKARRASCDEPCEVG